MRLEVGSRLVSGVGLPGVYVGSEDGSALGASEGSGVGLFEGVWVAE